jgi:hypothetical protein
MPPFPLRLEAAPGTTARSAEKLLWFARYKKHSAARTYSGSPALSEKRVEGALKIVLFTHEELTIWPARFYAIPTRRYSLRKLRQDVGPRRNKLRGDRCHNLSGFLVRMRRCGFYRLLVFVRKPKKEARRFERVVGGRLIAAPEASKSFAVEKKQEATDWFPGERSSDRVVLDGDGPKRRERPTQCDVITRIVAAVYEPFEAFPKPLPLAAR